MTSRASGVAIQKDDLKLWKNILYSKCWNSTNHSPAKVWQIHQFRAEHLFLRQFRHGMQSNPGIALLLAEEAALKCGLQFLPVKNSTNLWRTAPCLTINPEPGLSNGNSHGNAILVQQRIPCSDKHNALIKGGTGTAD